MPVNRRYGPTGSVKVVATPPTVKLSLTAKLVSFNSSVSVAPSTTPGTFTETVPLNLPANPAAVAMK